MTLSPAPAALAVPSRAVVLVGDVRAGLASLETNSVQCVVTSPPYLHLRDYGVAGQIGLEATPAEYVAVMVDVFRAIRRVLHPTGTVFCNIADSYAGSGKGKTGHNGIGDQERRQGFHDNYHLSRDNQTRPRWPTYAKPKDLMGVPWRLALALQDDGWWWRSTIVWAKKACMPESVTDRPTNAWEPLLLFSRSRTYFWDADAVREEAEYGRRDWSDVNANLQTEPGRSRGIEPIRGKATVSGAHPETGRNLRNVWDLRGEPVSDFWLLGPSAFPGSHFATFVPEVPRRCILAGTSEKGQCPHCGAPWERVVETGALVSSDGRAGSCGTTAGDHITNSGFSRATDAPSYYSMARRERALTGWRPSCACPAHEPVPQTVLDPFGGAMTTAMVAARLGRDSVSIELNAQYAEMGAERIRQDAGFMANVELREVGA